MLAASLATSFAASRARAAAAPHHATCDTDRAQIPARYRRVLQVFCAERRTLGVVGSSLAVAVGGALRFTATAGEACRGGRAVAPGTAFRLGSITKLLTAALAMRLVDAGHIALDAPLAPLLPELAGGPDERAREISLRHLLSHGAGLADPPAHALGADEGWLFALAEAPLRTSPGDLWSYANVGYALVGLALERRSGAPYPAALERQILAPLAAASVTADLDLALQSSPACGHLGRAGVPLDLRADLELGALGARWTVPAGGIVAAPAALVELALGLFDPLRSPLSAAALAELTTPALATHERPGESYGLGLRRVPLVDGSALYAHAGDTGDFAAELYLAPDRGFALALAGNTGAPMRATALAALHDLLGADLRPPAPAAAPDRYAGDFDAPDLGLLHIDRASLTVTSDALGLHAAPLEHRGDHRFRLPARHELGAWRFVFADDAPRATHLRVGDSLAARVR